MGVLAANGIGLPAFWNTLELGQSGIGPITLFDTRDFFLKIAGEITHFNFSDYANGRMKPSRIGRHTQLAIVATKMALEDAGLTEQEMASAGAIPMNLGVSSCAIEMLEKGMKRLVAHGPSKTSPYIVSNALPHGITNTVAEYFSIRVDGRTVSSACQSGADTIQLSYEAIRSGRSEVAIAGGADAPLTPLTVASFCSGGLRPSDYDEKNPQKASRPFDMNRTGGILAEGAGVLVFESLHHALARGARPLVEITGIHNRQDEPGSLAATGLADSMKGALANAGLMPNQVDYICAHGPSEPIMDEVETNNIKHVFGDHASQVPISSIKGVTGNALAAQGPMQVIASALAIEHQVIPPTANLEHPDPKCDLDFVPLHSRHAKVNRVLVNVHGLGGGNTSMVLQSVGES